jgi:hypothetical protein
MRSKTHDQAAGRKATDGVQKLSRNPLLVLFDRPKVHKQRQRLISEVVAIHKEQGPTWALITD